MTRTVLIVDDHASFRASARSLLEHGDFVVVGEAGDGLSGLAAAAETRPSIVLLDVQLPDIDGFEVARRLAADPSPPQIVLISSRDASSYRTRLDDTPACAFLPKSELSESSLAAAVG
jgi:DNA-binding NarL/FixJ family response regulator